MATKKTIHEGAWRCRVCDALLGIRQNDGVHVRFKDLSIFVRGQAQVACRRCTHTNTVETVSAAA